LGGFLGSHQITLSVNTCILNVFGSMCKPDMLPQNQPSLKKIRMAMFNLSLKSPIAT